MVDSRAVSGAQDALRPAAGGGGGGGSSAEGDTGRVDLVSRSLPCTPQKEPRNPLLTSYTPPASLKAGKARAVGGIFATSAGSRCATWQSVEALPLLVATWRSAIAR